LRVVVADDDPDYRLLVRLGLEGSDDVGVVAEASDAGALVAVVGDTPSDLVLLDCSMPGGLAAIPAVRAAAPEVRIVLVSSLPSSELLLAAPAAGAVGFLTKDVRVMNLADALRQLAPLLDVASQVLATADASLPEEAHSAPAARGLVRGALKPWVDDETMQSALLAVSELVTNAVVHARSEVEVRVCVLRDAIRIEIGDDSELLPTMRHAEAHETSGRGIALVSLVSSRWGVRPRRLGKTVWFELPRPVPAAAP
jgi:DNA-binding NarL/FixJ family response regulator